MIDIPCTEDQSHRPVEAFGHKFFHRFRMRIKFAMIARTECIPACGIVAKPFSQRRAGGQFLRPAM
ncbi:hypothetical protein AUC70_04430 [Methyloceanibacter stevinii]|uniref:Uncharacterized protein n=1 Tax=Methyloceanibacter stevinii TaxID=1774970 RepID=A0A1E3VNA0_9HYPH|nr:hypothetical protein AUC70_04430 [Methyloceanibacter stevinii]